MRGRVPALVASSTSLWPSRRSRSFAERRRSWRRTWRSCPPTGIVSQLCGDAHVRNLGAYAAPDGRLVFDINDFDETIRGPFEWDLKRMAASLVLAGRAAGHKDSPARKAAEACIARYAEQMREFARMPHLEVGRFLVHRIDVAEPVHAALSQGRARHAAAYARAAYAVRLAKPGAPRRFKESKPMLTRVTGSRAAAVLASLGPYREMLEPQRQHLLDFYRPVDVAFKVVGTGSVGLRDYCIYLEGNGPRRSALPADQGRDRLSLRALSA